jgi:hypothetical protein
MPLVSFSSGLLWQVSRPLSCLAVPERSARSGSADGVESRGGKLMVKDGKAPPHPGAHGHEQAGIRDVIDPEVSFDGTKIVLGLQPDGEGFPIYGSRAEGSTPGRSRRASADRSRPIRPAPSVSTYDDYDPCYLPDGRGFCFDEVSRDRADARLRSTTLRGTDGTDVHRITRALRRRL